MPCLRVVLIILLVRIEKMSTAILACHMLQLLLIIIII